MNRMNLLSLIRITILPFLATNCGLICRDCSREPVPVYMMDEEFKAYVVFPNESYWIYVNQDIEEDSVRIFKQEISINTSPNDFPFDYEQLFQHTASSFFNDTLLGSGIADEIFPDNRIFYAYAEKYLSNYLVTGVQYFSKHQPGDMIHFTDDSKLLYALSYPQFEVEGVIYNDVKVFENLIPLSDGRLPHKIYYSRYVGVIRKELYNGQVWNLKRYFINK